ncbi:signal peptide containing protein [Theileria equi strain WA]|uniref:Signal peptide containing protein n=1 Tax=Theileria equi strain WA TaxID=1537102 RepID=L1LE30_THEEQ|nr:signal peptide containing protein [Theileria equi strain WA]EKX73539.1 signal peptide containing protein [Theileria equi strain WA]|eukprot:XP_004832991.1 signal peptide containing protein [Theileria equi strain WA]
MKVFSVLFTVSLVGLCHGGGDDGKGALKRAVGGKQPTPNPAQPTPQKLPRANGQSAAQPGQKATPSTQQGQGDDTLDLAHPDMTKVNLVTDCKNGIKTKRYTPTGASKVTSVVDGDKELWKKAEDYQKFLSATLSSKGNSSLLLISTNAGIKHFKKDSTSWTSSNEKDYEEKLREMRYTD